MGGSFGLPPPLENSMTDSQTAELVAIAAAAGFRAEYHPTNPPRLIGFGKFNNGKFDYGIRVDDFAAIVQAARLSALEEAAKVCSDMAAKWDVDLGERYGMAAADCAAAIRQIAAQAGKPQGEKT
jgi:hypothetical protein